MFCSLKWMRAILRRIRCRGRKLRKLSHGFNWQSLPFAAMEVSTQLEQVFRLIDANGDGRISSPELRDLLLCFGYDKSAAAAEAEGMVREVDFNGDGFIDLEEFLDVMGSRSQGADVLMDAFLMFDADKNGFISADELQTVLISLGYRKCSLDECLLMIRGVDRNGDGMVDFDEFRSMMTACKP